MKVLLMTLTMLLSVWLIAQPVLSQDVIDGIVAYWDFNDMSGETATDVTGNGHDGTLMGDPEWTKDGKFGGAIEFDQDGDEVNIPFHEDLNPEEFSICAWANVDPGSANHRAVISSRDEPPTSGFIIYAEPGNSWQFWTGDGVTPWVSIQGPSVNLGEWDHLVGTYADGEQMFYVNGKFVEKMDSNPNFNAQRDFLIGAGANERATHEYLFKGRIDEVRLYNRVLTEKEIATVMDSESLDVAASGKIAVTWGAIKSR